MKQSKRDQIGEWLRNSAPNLLIVFLGIAFYMALEHFGVVSSVIAKIYSVCLPFIAGAIIAFLLDGPVRYLERRFHWKRTPTVWGVFLTAVLLLILLFWLLVPQLIDSITQLIRQLPTYLESLTNLVKVLGTRYNFDTAGVEGVIGSYSSLVTQAADYVSNAMPQILNYSLRIGNGVLQAIEAIMASIYILLSKNALMRQLRMLNHAIFPQHVASVLAAVFRQICRSFTGFFNGKIVDSIIIGIISFFALQLLGMPYVVLLSVVIGVTNVIPFFGPFMGAIPNTMILFIIDPVKALEYVIFTLVLQQFDGNVLGPRILGDSIGLPPLWVLVSIVVSGGLFGFAGMLLGVPLFAVIYSLLGSWTRQRLAEKQEREAAAAAAAQPPAAEQGAPAPQNP